MGNARHPQVSRQTGQLTRVGALVSFEIVTTARDFAALEPEWTALVERAGDTVLMFQSHAWLAAWLKQFRPVDDGSLCVVLVRRDPRTGCALPLEVVKQFGLRQLVFMGAPVSQYGDALVEPGIDRAAMVRQAWTLAVRHANPALAWLGKVREDAGILPFLNVASAREIAWQEAPFADLARYGGIESFRTAKSAKRLKNIRRLRRRLEERGQLDVVWNMAGEQASDAVRATFVMKRAWLRSQGLVSIAFAEPGTEQFFTDVCSRPDTTGVEVSAVKSAGELTNTQIMVEHAGRLGLHITAYNLKFEKSGAGVIHIEALFEEAYRRGIRTLDFLAPRHAYKDDWADGMVRVSDYAIPLTVSGRIYTLLYLRILREGVKRLVRLLPGPVARGLAGRFL